MSDPQFHTPQRPDPGAVLVPEDFQIGPNDLVPLLDDMILSASGWRAVFAADMDEQSATPDVRTGHLVLVGLAARVFTGFVEAPGARARMLVGQDTRPTGTAVAHAAIRVFLCSGVRVSYAHVCAIPQILAFARGSDADGFFYVSASHNPIGHNGLKMGFSDGSVAGGDVSRRMIDAFRTAAVDQSLIDEVVSSIRQRDRAEERKVYAGIERTRAAARGVYQKLTREVVEGPGPLAAAAWRAVESSLSEKRPGIVVDFNGSARTETIDRDFLSTMGCRVHAINDRPGEIRHQIVPEGPGLQVCLDELRRRSVEDGHFILGYVPDNDGDRGNLVVAESSGSARELEAQEVFALSAVSELSWLVHTGAMPWNGTSAGSTDLESRQRRAAGQSRPVAVVVNGPTSMRIDRIAAAFGARVFRAEVGEANVVNLARELRNKGYLVRFLGEGSNGGNITHPSTVRDPLLTVCALLKLLHAQEGEVPSPARIWLELSGPAGGGPAGHTSAGGAPDLSPSLASLLASLPKFTTTSAFSPEAKMHVGTSDHGLLKTLVEEDWERIWPNLDDVRQILGVSGYHIENYEGITVLPGRGNRTGDFRGGFKILLTDEIGTARGFLWMRGSGTEPVFRIMVDVEGIRPETEARLLAVLRDMVERADDTIQSRKAH